MNYCPICAQKLQSSILDGENRRICSAPNCSYVYWDNPVPVVTAVVEFENTYIIARNHQWPEAVFSVIAGYLEKAETPEQAVVREVSEELGLSAVVKNYISCYSFFEKNQLILAYHVVATGKIKLNHELVEMKQLSKNEFMEYDFNPLEITVKLQQDFFRLIRS